MRTSKLLIHQVQLFSCWEEVVQIQLPHQHNTSSGLGSSCWLGNGGSWTAATTGSCSPSGAVAFAGAGGGWCSDVALYHAQQALHASNAFWPHLGTVQHNQVYDTNN